jgi:hypothetical protein
VLSAGSQQHPNTVTHPLPPTSTITHCVDSNATDVKIVVRLWTSFGGGRGVGWVGWVGVGSITRLRCGSRGVTGC